MECLDGRQNPHNGAPFRAWKSLREARITSPLSSYAPDAIKPSTKAQRLSVRRTGLTFGSASTEGSTRGAPLAPLACPNISQAGSTPRVLASLSSVSDLGVVAPRNQLLTHWPLSSRPYELLSFRRISLCRPKSFIPACSQACASRDAKVSILVAPKVDSGAIITIMFIKQEKSDKLDEL